MTDEELLHSRIVKKAIDTRTLLVLSFIDLAFGIVSMLLTSVDWQICSLLASVLSLIWILKIVVCYKDEVKSNVSTLIISVLDIITGAISVALAIYALQAVVVLISSLKVAKVAVQTSKAVKLAEVGKPILKKIFPKIGALIATFCATNTKKRGNGTMADKVVKEKKAKKQSQFAIYLKNNPKTIAGIVMGFLASAGSGAGLTCGLVVGGYAIPLWASILLGIILFAGLMVGLCFGCLGAGWESPVMVSLRQLLKKLGYGEALEVVEKAYDASEKEKAELEAKAIVEAQKEHDVYEAEYKELVASGNYLKSLDEFIAERKAEAEEKAKAEKEVALKNAFVKAVMEGKFVGSFDAFCEQNK